MPCDRAVLKLDYTLTPADFLSQAAIEMRQVRLPFGGLSWLVWGVFVAALLLVSGDAFPNVLVVVFIAFIMFQGVASLQRSAWLRRVHSAERLRGLAGPQHIEITEQHLRETAPNRDVTWQWQDHSTLYETPTHILIKPTPVNTVIIPRSAFASDAARVDLVSFVRMCIEQRKRAQDHRTTGPQK